VSIAIYFCKNWRPNCGVPDKNGAKLSCLPGPDDPRFVDSMERKLRILRIYTKVDFSRLALTYRRSPAVGFDDKEGGFRVLISNPYIGQTNYSDVLSITPFPS